MRGNYTAALNDNTLGLHLLGVDVNAAPTRREADIMFEQVKNEILAVGFDDILSIPRARDSRTDLAIALLNDAGANAYWSTGEGFSDVIGLTVSMHISIESSDTKQSTDDSACTKGRNVSRNCVGILLGTKW